MESNVELSDVFKLLIVFLQININSSFLYLLLLVTIVVCESRPVKSDEMISSDNKFIPLKLKNRNASVLDERNLFFLDLPIFNIILSILHFVSLHFVKHEFLSEENVQILPLISPIKLLVDSSSIFSFLFPILFLYKVVCDRTVSKFNFESFLSALSNELTTFFKSITFLLLIMLFIISTSSSLYLIYKPSLTILIMLSDILLTEVLNLCLSLPS